MSVWLMSPGAYEPLISSWCHLYFFCIRFCYFMADKKAELKKLNRSILICFLELLDILINDPASPAVSEMISQLMHTSRVLKLTQAIGSHSLVPRPPVNVVSAKIMLIVWQKNYFKWVWILKKKFPLSLSRGTKRLVTLAFSSSTCITWSTSLDLTRWVAITTNLDSAAPVWAWAKDYCTRH